MNEHPGARWSDVQLAAGVFRPWPGAGRPAVLIVCEGQDVVGKTELVTATCEELMGRGLASDVVLHRSS